MDDYVQNGHLKRVVSHLATTLKLPHGPQSNFLTVRFLKSIKLQMSCAHYFRTIDGVQSLDYMVCVEVEPGETRPYKNTNLPQEVLAMRLAPTPDGTLGSTFINGAHMVLLGPSRGQLQ